MHFVKLEQNNKINVSNFLFLQKLCKWMLFNIFLCFLELKTREILNYLIKFAKNQTTASNKEWISIDNFSFHLNKVMATWKPFDKFIGFFKIEVLLKVRLLHGRFSRFINCTNGTKPLKNWPKSWTVWKVRAVD